jgi:predicted phage tail protein
MAVIGLLLMLGCAAVAVDAVVQNTQVIHAVAFNQHVTGLSLGALFIAGCVVGLIFALGMAMFFGGIGRAARLRRERRALRRDTAETDALRERNSTLEQRLSSQDDAYPAEPVTTGTSDVTADDNAGRHRV